MEEENKNINDEENQNKQLINSIIKEKNDEINDNNKEIDDIQSTNNEFSSHNKKEDTENEINSQKSEKYDKNKIIENLNNTCLNYNYGSDDPNIVNKISQSNIKFNMSDNNINDIIGNRSINNSKNNKEKILNIKYENLSDKSNYLNSDNKSYHSLYDIFKNKYKNNDNSIFENNKPTQESNLKNYINTKVQRNYYTLEPHEIPNHIMLENKIKTPLRNEYENKSDNVNLYFTEYKINSFTPKRYFSLNNLKNNDIFIPKITDKITYLENKLNEYNKIKIKYEEEINNYRNQIKIYKNSFQIISDFFDFITKSYIPDFFPKKNIFEINNQNMLYIYFKNLEDYIIKLNSELNDYKYKYQKLLDIDSSRHSLSPKYSFNIHNKTKEYKSQNISFFDENEKNLEQSHKNNNDINKNNNNDIYKSLEKRIILLEKELFSRNNDINKIRNKSATKISIMKKVSKTTQEKDTIEKKGNKDNNNRCIRCLMKNKIKKIGKAKKK